MAEKVGQVEIKTSYPKSETLKTRVNLKARGVNGLKSRVLKKERKGILSNGR